MKRYMVDGGLVLLTACLLLILLIAVKLPFFTIFLIGCFIFIAGLISSLFFDKATKPRRITILVSGSGGFSALLIWLLVRFLLSRLQ
ncbi:hypothetical protein PU629_18430 [Pullulanibacillus sp. KACC 23026]|uniref:hypothetical protein n=1 Tax=Pullulanibacillus sp. KACC 23026 TaxID=3028315 RepID=UPI0023B0DBE1|nr:hypothetical protein [Pullulanibacillus sp. KACC 23026]WEG12077.1 hypothetical protein PU629_18430 [Pullulanibacillus sp. KACC 23026]